MDNFRELERKYLLKNISYHVAVGTLEAFLEGDSDVRETVGSGEDVFWKISESEFARLREFNFNSEGLNCYGELTYKKNDTGSIEDRLETNIDLMTKKDYDNAEMMLTSIHGKRSHRCWKKYHIFWISDNTNIVVYKTDLDIPTILEVEGNSLLEVELLSEIVSMLFPGLKQENRTLLELSEVANGKIQ